MPGTTEDRIVDDQPSFRPIEDRFYQQVSALLKDGKATGNDDADAAIIAHARTFSAKGMATPIVVGGVETIEPRTLAARARLLSDLSVGAKFAGPGEMAIRIESDREVMLSGAAGTGFAKGGGTRDDRVQSMSEYHRLPEARQDVIMDTIMTGANVSQDMKARLTESATGLSEELAGKAVVVIGDDRSSTVYEDIGAPFKEAKGGILAQATEASKPLSRQIASAVMSWAHDENAFKHMVSFNVLDEAVEYGLQGIKERDDLKAPDVERIQRAVRDWSRPHMAEGASLKDMDAAVAKAARDQTSEKPSLQAKGPSAQEMPIVQRGGTER